MAAFLARRLLHGIIVVALVATIVFVLIHAAPGDAFSREMENPAMTESVRASWRHAYGLDRPLGEQYVRYVTSVFRGNLGFSLTLHRPVADILVDALPNTILLMGIGLAAGFLLGINVAITQVRNLGKRADRILGAISLTFFSLPDFWFATLMMVAFGLWLHILPVGGVVDVDHEYMGLVSRIVDRLEHLIVPALTLALLYFPLIARYQRAALIDTLSSDYVVTARAKGVSESRVIRRHALRNALLPIVTLLGVSFPALLTGAVFIEKVFSWPGMGLVIVNSIGSRDYPLLTAAVILGSAFVVAGSIVADLLYRLLDPRLRDDR